MATVNLQNLSIGQVSVQTGTGGTPDHVAISGTTYMDTQTGLLYLNTDGASLWVPTTASPLGLLALWGNLPFFTSFSAQSFGVTNFSATTIYSGGTPLEQLFSLSGANTRVQPGVNITTGGTALNPIVNVLGSPTFTGVTSQTISGTSVSATTYYSGSTELGSLFAPVSVVPTYVQPGSNITTGGTASRPIVHVLGSPTFTGVTSQTLSGTSVSATTFFSGSTNIGSIFSPFNHTHVSSAITDSTYGGNYSADADLLLKVNADGGISLSSSATTPAIITFNPYFTSIQALSTNGYGVEAASVNLAGAYIESINDHGLHVTSVNGPGALIVTTDAGNIEDILNLHNNSATGLNVKNDGGLQWTTPTGAATTRTNLGISALFVAPGANAYTASTVFNTIVGVVGSPVFTGVTAQSISGTSISATTYYSGSTPLNTILSSLAGGTPTYVQPGSNITTGGTASRPVVGVLGSPTFTGVTAQTISGTNVSATTFFSGSTNIGSLFAPVSVVPTFVQPGSNITTGGTASRPIVNVLGSPVFTGVTAQTISGTSVSATTFFSGSTNIGSLFAPASVVPTYVQPGTNITTGGTASSPIISVAGSPTFTGVTAQTISGTSVSAVTFYEATVSLSSKYAPKDLSITLSGGTYVLALTDDSRLVDMSGASTQNVVVPRNSAVAFPIGSQVMVAQTGAGQVSFSADTGVSILSYNSQLKLTGLYATASLVKKDTNTWLLGGNLTT